jgi:hypothetical protein
LFPSNPPQDKDYLPELTPLNTKTDILTQDATYKTLIATNEFTVTVFVKLNNGDRTSKFMIDTKSNYRSILKIEGIWHLEVSPSPNQGKHSSTRLRVLTEKPSVEIIELPPLSMQKWTFVAVLRQGRRFDVIYDNRIVSSYLLSAYPVVNGNSIVAGYSDNNNVNIMGNSLINGSIIHVFCYNSRLSPSQIEQNRLPYVDTNNALASNDFTYLLPSVILPNLNTSCSSGSCDYATKLPKKMILKWESPYS